MIGASGLRRLRAIFAKDALSSQRVRSIKQGVKVLRSKQASTDDTLVSHIRAVSKRPVNDWLINSQRFSVAGRRRVVAQDIKSMRKKYGSKEVRNMLIRSAKNYRSNDNRY